MPCKSKPFFRKQTQSWYCTIGGRQVPLGREQEAAEEEFHRLMVDRSQLSGERVTRRYIATLADLKQIRGEVRVAVEELMHISGLA